MKACAIPWTLPVHMFRAGHEHRARFGPLLRPDVHAAGRRRLFMEALKRLIDLDRDWVPKSPDALYIRPTMISTQRGLGVKASTEYLFYIIIGPVGSYFAGGSKPLRVKAEDTYVRSAPAGVGGAEPAQLRGRPAADQTGAAGGFDQIVWLDARTMSSIEEMGPLNIAFVYGDKVITAGHRRHHPRVVTRDSVGGVLCRDFGLN
ncbi:MAG: hypothetical protein IPH09_11285 [bacterium]|nr:hypothetical protein [bacterium]